MFINIALRSTELHWRYVSIVSGNASPFHVFTIVLLGRSGKGANQSLCIHVVKGRLGFHFCLCSLGLEMGFNHSAVVSMSSLAGDWGVCPTKMSLLSVFLFLYKGHGTQPITCTKPVSRDSFIDGLMS